VEDIRDLINPAEFFRRLNREIAEIDRSIRELGEALEGGGTSPEGLGGDFVQRLERARREVEEAKRTTECGWCQRQLDKISDAIAHLADLEKLASQIVEGKRASALGKLDRDLEEMKKLKEKISQSS